MPEQQPVVRSRLTFQEVAADRHDSDCKGHQDLLSDNSAQMSVTVLACSDILTSLLYIIVKALESCNSAELQLEIHSDRGIHTPVNALHGHSLCFQLVSLRFGRSIPSFVKLQSTQTSFQNCRPAATQGTSASSCNKLGLLLCMSSYTY